jgi:hypothetical protein
MLKRKLTAALIAAAAALVVAQSASAAQPFREPLDPPSGVLSDCGYDIGVEPGGTARQILTIFGDGRLTIRNHAEPTLTNLESGLEQSVRLRYVFTERQGHGSLTGQSLFSLLPGDVGPSGDVSDGGLIYVVGRLTYVMDPDTGAITSMKVTGTVTDVCEAMAS